MFDHHLRRALADIPSGGKLRGVFFAHGGLVSESSGLQIASRHIAWWQRNQIYPIYFIWETGFFETISQLLEQARSKAAPVSRDLADFTSDPLIEVAARALQAPRIWAGMKWSAEHAMDPPASSAAGGAAHYFASRLVEFCNAHPQRLELHGVGHSAGTIFHTHFLPLLQQLGAPSLKSLHFMGPAVRVDTFKEKLLRQMGASGAAEHLTVYTMKRNFERDDNCAHIYRKSLLYLVHYALEDERKTPILGLEEVSARTLTSSPCSLPPTPAGPWR